MTSSGMLRKVVDKTEAMDAALRWSLLERVNDCVKELQLKCTSERTNALNNDEATNSFLWVLEGIFIHGLTNSFLKSKSPFSAFMSSSLFSSSRGSAPDSSTSAVPNPSFWEFVLVFLHRDIIDQINGLHLIHTDVGRCRAWLRIALNEGLLLSFLENMTLKSNRRCLRAFYRSSAFLRDTEKCDILKNYLMGIELLDFRLVINNSFLNHWNSGPLSLVGLWVDENESVQQGIDVAQNLEAKEIQAIPKLHQRQRNPTPPQFYSELEHVLRRPNPPLLSEEDALRIILSSSPRAHPPPPQTLPKGRPSSSTSSVVPVKVKQVAVNKPRITRNMEATTQDLVAVNSDNLSVEEAQEIRGLSPVPSISPPSSVMLGPTSSTPLRESAFTTAFSENGLKGEITSGYSADASTTTGTSMDIESPIDDERSYADLLLKYQQRSKQQQELLQLQQNNNEQSHGGPEGSNASHIPDLVRDEENQSRKSSTGNPPTATSPPTSTSACSSSVGDDEAQDKKRSKLARKSSSSHNQSQTRLDFIDSIELIKLPCQTPENIMELMPRISKYTKIIACETGLDAQNYACKICGTSIGMIYGAARLCHFTGFSYCVQCHISQEKVIPSRVLLNWDFGLYAVCKQANNFLEDLKDQPIFDVQEINPTLYTEIDECGQVKILRTKLFYIAMYLKTCKNTKALNELKKDAHSKEYLLDSIHLYSLSDLLAIPNRSLATHLKKLVGAGSAHILSCTICREKGFICEVCRKPQVIFPFELERIFKCIGCGAVYHNTCMDYGRKCPRCVRWTERESNNHLKDSADMED